jgi:zeaxanthin glucosyltransferase
LAEVACWGGCRNRKLSALIEEVLSNPEYRQNANNMKQVIAETNGLEKAVDLLELAFNLA